MLAYCTEQVDEFITEIEKSFVIENMYDILTSIDEIPEYLTMWADLFNGQLSQNNKLKLTLPIIVVTPNKHVISQLSKLVEVYEISNDLEISKQLIEHGMLPKLESVIINYINTYMMDLESDEQIIFKLFNILGYIDSNNLATDKLLLTLDESDNKKYAQALLYARNNTDIANLQIYTNSLFEILKLINITIFNAVSKIN